MEPRNKSAGNRATIEGWLEDQKARPQARAMRSAGWTANKLLRPMAKKHGSTTSVAVLNANWHQFAGPKFGKLSRPVRVQGTKSGRTVVVDAAGPAASLVAASSDQILARINAFVGGDGFTAIRVQQARMERDQPIARQPSRGLRPSEEQALQGRLADISSPELKAALEKLGRSVISKEQ